MSKIRSIPNLDLIEDEAALWVVKVHGSVYKTQQSVPDEILRELELWMGQSPTHRRVFFEILGGWDAIGVLEELADIVPLSELPRKNTARSRLKTFFQSTISGMFNSRGYIWSGSIAVALVFLLWIGMNYGGQDPLEYGTGIGERESVVLEDGSILTLNTDTRVTVEYSGDRRLVNLLKGEANFEVAKDSDRPFFVYADEGVVMAVGTAFNVIRRNDYVGVIVTEGKVKVFSAADIETDDLVQLAEGSSAESVDPDESAAPDQKQVLLAAGESVRYSQDTVIKEAIEAQRFAQELAWQEGSLIFLGETLEQALEEISRYTDKRLLIVDPAIREHRVGGRYKLDDIDALINSLTMGLDIKAQYSGENTILFSMN